MKTTRCLIIALLASSPVALAQVSGNVNAAGGVTNHALPPMEPQVGVGATGAAGVNADRPLPADTNAAANANAQIQGPNAQASGAAVVATALSPADTMRDIQSTAFDARKSALNEVSDRIDAGRKLVNSLKRDPRAVDADVRTKFDSALNDVNAKEKILKRSLKEARNASNADEWSVAQTTLAADYQVYATAVAELNATIQK
jgi:hypothetical protein